MSIISRRGTTRVRPSYRTGVEGLNIAEPSVPFTNLWGWWKASDAYTDADGTGTIITANDTAIYSLKDLSGNGRHFNQATGSFQCLFKTNTIGGKPAIKGDGVNDYLQVASAASAHPISVYCVFKTGSTLNAFDPIWQHTTTGNNGLNVNTNQTQLVKVDASDIIHDYIGSINTSYLSAATLNSAGNQSALQIDNRTTVTITSSALTSINQPFQLLRAPDGAFYGTSYVAELIYYTAAHNFSTGDGLKVRQYLNSEYGLGLAI
jgi:hypothetical protein